MLLVACLALLTNRSDAHNLNQRADYLAFDSPSLALFQSRAALGQPLIQSGDTIGLLLKATPDVGTATGAGGYSTFFIPLGTQITDVEYGRLDWDGAFVTMLMKGQSILALGDGSIGAKATPGLIGLQLGPNITGQTSLTVSASGLARGTLAGVYSDTGIFYSTDPKTAWQSWVATGGIDGNPATTDNSLTNNSGDVVVPSTRWDAEQLMAFGMRSPSTAIIDAADQRGNAPWGMGSAVAGPESGYAWSFNKTYWDTHATDPARMRNSIATGPWQRIKYPGSLASKDTPGLVSTALGYVGVDASEIGYDLSPSNPLPPTTSLTDNTSPKAVRVAWGAIELHRPEYARIKLKIISGPGQPNSGFNANGFLQAYAETFGGDAGGEFGNKDHLWRYYEPSVVGLPAGPYLLKQASKPLLLRNEEFSFKFWMVNFGSSPLNNVMMEDTLPSGVTFLNASPVQNSGPNPLRWNFSVVPPLSMQSFVVNVKASGSGSVTNTARLYSNYPVQTSSDTVFEGALALLYPDKSVIPTSALPGDVVEYTITMLNAGTVSSSNPLVISERLPSGFNYVGFVGATINGSAAGVGNVAVNSTNPATPVFTVNRGINPGKNLTITFRAQISLGEQPGKYCNQFSYQYDGKIMSTGGLACVTVNPKNIGLGIGNLVFFDANNNGHADDGEGVPGVTLELYADGSLAEVDTPVATTTTDASGLYLFQDMQSGYYFVHIPSSMFQAGGPLHSDVSIAASLFGDDDVGEDGLNNTDLPTQGVSSGLKYIAPGFAPTDQDGERGMNHTMDNAMDASVDLTVDFGFQQPVGVGNLVFVDLNHNGHADTGEGIGDVIVELYDAESIPGTSNYLFATTTTSDGHYLFDNLPPGDYFLHISAFNFAPGGPLAGMLSLHGAEHSPATDDNVGENGVDSLAPMFTGISSEVVHLQPGSAPVDSAPGSQSGETGFAASEDNVLDSNGDLTIDFGFTNVPPTTVGVGNLVFEDLNGNFRFDPGEGLDGVLVQLFSSSVADPLNGTPLAATLTANGGSYFFGDLQPGSYVVFIPPSNFTSSGKLYKRLSIPGHGADDSIDDDYDENGIDSVEPSVTGIQSPVVTLTVGDEPTANGNETGFNSYLDDGADGGNDLTIDFGFYQFVGLGNMVFKDGNANGHYDPGEGVAGVTLELYQEGADPAFDSPLATTISEVDGHYSFNGLLAGSYFVHVPGYVFTQGQPLENSLSVPDTGLLPGGDDEVDEDGIDSATPVLAGISTRVVTLAPGACPTNDGRETGAHASEDDEYDSNFDATIDLGFYHPATPMLGVGNLVFKDANHNGAFDAGEGAAGVVVLLFPASADPLTTTPLDSAITDERGAYLLTTSQPGDYLVFVPPSQFQAGGRLYGYLSMPSNGGDNGHDDNLDENGIDAPVPAISGIRSSSIHLAAGTEPVESGYLAEMDDAQDNNTDLTIDFGFALNCETIILSSGALPPGTVGENFSMQLPASGGYPPYTWQMNGGTLPPGFSLSAAGVLSGTPADADTYAFAVQITDAAGCTAGTSYQFSTLPKPTGGIGNAIYIDANHNNRRDPGEGVENVEIELFHAGDNPLTAVPIQEVVTDAEGVYWFTSLAEGDYFVYIDSGEFAVANPLFGLVSIPDSSGDDGIDDDVPGNDSGIDDDHPEIDGISSIIVHLRFGQEPVDTSTETGLDASADNDNDANVNATIDLGFRNPCPPIIVTPSQLPTATKGVHYSRSFSATGGTGAITFTLRAGALPPSFALSNDGVLSGNTNTVGNYTFTVRASDSDGCYVDTAVLLEVVNPGGVGNLVFFDRNGNGRADEGEGVNGVTVQLFLSGQTPGVDAAQASTITSNSGRFLIDGLQPGSYNLFIPKAMFAPGAPLWGMRSLPGVMTLGDDDSGEDGEDSIDPTTSGVSTGTFALQPGILPAGAAESGLSGSSDDARDADIDLTRDFGFVDLNALPATFAAWQTAHSLAGAPTANGDGDAMNDLLEYAVGSNPASGVTSSNAFSLAEDQSSTRMSVVLRRRHGGLADLTYTLQVIGDLTQSPAGWVTSVVTPVTVNNGDGTETLTFASIDQDAGLNGSSLGFARLLVSLDANHDNTPEATATSAVLGWQHRSLGVQHQTASPAFVKQAVFTGTVDAVNGAIVNLATSVGTGSILAAMTGGLAYYAEVISGDNEGQRWEIDEASSTATTLVLLPTDALSTTTTVPANLAGNVLAVRAHWRVVDLFPPADYHATGSAATADQVLLWDPNTKGYITTYVNTVSGNKLWQKFGGAGLTVMDNTIVGPASATFVRPRVNTVTSTIFGQVRTWKFAMPLPQGLSFISNPYPIAQSFADRLMSVSNGFTGTTSANTADRINYWNGDASSSTSYYTFYLFKNGSTERWLRFGQVGGIDHTTDKLFLPGTGLFFTSVSGQPNWLLSVPWTP